MAAAGRAFRLDHLLCEDDAPLDGEFGFVSEDRIGSGRSQFARGTFPPPLQPIKLLAQLRSPQHIVIDDTSKQEFDSLISPLRFDLILSMMLLAKATKIRWLLAPYNCAAHLPLAHPLDLS